MNVLRSLVVLAVLFVTGCAGDPLVVRSEKQEMPPPAPGKAQIVFLNPTNAVAGALLTGIYDVRDNDHKEFLGMLGSKNKMIQDLTPGKHLFMSHTYAYSYFLDADVEAGKRYYVLLRFVYARGLQLRPIRNSGVSEFSVGNPKFDDWKNSPEFVVKTAAADAWYAKYKHVVDDAQAKAWADWQSKSPDQKAELTLNKDDFIDK